MKEFGRELRVADFLRDELARIISHEMRDPRVDLVTIAEVRVARDLSYADIYVSSVRTRDVKQRDELVAALNGAAGYLRSAIAKRSTMRTTPRLRFHYDEVAERGAELDALIERAVQADRRAHDTREHRE
jgi:ribosome-binding factor A